VTGALVRKLMHGQGTRVEASLLNAGIDLQVEPLTLYYAAAGGLEKFERNPNLASWYHEAPYGVYRLRDAWVAFSLSKPEAFGRALNSERIAAFAGRDTYALREEFAAVFAEAVAAFTLEDLEPRLIDEGIWYARVQNYDDLRVDPQLLHNNVFLDVPVGQGTATLVNHPIRYDGKGAEVRVLATRLGENSREILEELGYDAARIDTMIADGAVHVG